MNFTRLLLVASAFALLLVPAGAEEPPHPTFSPPPPGTVVAKPSGVPQRARRCIAMARGREQDAGRDRQRHDLLSVVSVDLCHRWLRRII